MSRYVYVITGSNDYYAGDYCALYRDGQRIWSGYDGDIGSELLDAVLGEGVVEKVTVRKWTSLDAPEVLEL